MTVQPVSEFPEMRISLVEITIAFASLIASFYFLSFLFFLSFRPLLRRDPIIFLILVFFFCLSFIAL